MAERSADAKQFKRILSAIRKLKTFLGQVYRDICLKDAGNADVEARFARLLGLVKRLLAQQLKDKKRMPTLPTFRPHCHEPTGSV